MKKNAGKRIVKHPLYLFMVVGAILVLGVPAVMIRLGKRIAVSETVNVCVGISTGVLCLLWLILFVANFSGLMKAEEKTTVKNAVKAIKKGKTVILVRKRCVVGNLAFIIGLIAVYAAWILFFPSAEFLSVGFWIFRIASVLLTAVGAVASFVTPTKMLTYKDGFYTVKNDDKTITATAGNFSVSGKINDKRFDGKDVPARELYYDLIVTVNGKKVVLKKADGALFYEKIIKAIEKADGTANKE